MTYNLHGHSVTQRQQHHRYVNTTTMVTNHLITKDNDGKHHLRNLCGYAPNTPMSYYSTLTTTTTIIDTTTKETKETKTIIKTL